MSRTAQFLLVYSVLLLVATSGSAAERKLTGWSLPELDKVIASVADLKLRPIAVKGYASGNESLFDITFETTDAPGGWYIFGDLTADSLKARDTDFTVQGYRRVVTDRWQVNGQERFAAIWHFK